MKKLSPWLIGIGVALCFFGALIPEATRWFLTIWPREVRTDLLETLREKLSFCTTLFGWLNILMGLLCILMPGYLEMFTHPATGSIALQMSVFLALTVHCAVSLMMNLLANPLRTVILTVLMFLGILALVVLTWKYIDKRASIPLPPSGTFEISFAILYTIPIFLVVAAADEYILIFL